MHHPRLTASSAAVLALVLVAVWVLHTPVLEAGFLTDDYYALNVLSRRFDRTEPASRGNLEAVGGLFTGQAFEQFQLWRPLSLTTMAADYVFRGPDPRGFILTNLVCHLLAALMTWLLLRSLSGCTPGAAAGGTLLFAANPLVLENVVWMAVRSDPLAHVFGLASLVWRLRRPEARAGPLVLVAAALTCKETAVAYIAAHLLVGWRLAPVPRRRFRREAAAWGGLAALWFVARWAAIGNPLDSRYGGDRFTSFLDVGERIGGYARSLGVAVAPASDAVWDGAGLLALRVVMAGSTLAIVVVGLRTIGRRRGLVPLTAVLFLAPFAINGLVISTTTALVHTRILYASCTALAILAAAGMDSSRVARWAATVLLVSFVIAGLPHQRMYVESTGVIDRMLDSLREPLEAEGRRERTLDVVVLAYRERTWAGETLPHGGAIGAALRRPFVPRDHRLVRVFRRTGRTDTRSRKTLETWLRSGPLDAAVFVMTGPAGDDWRCDLISPGALGAPGELVPLTPPAGHVAAPAELLAGPLRFRVRASEGAASVQVTLVAFAGVFGLLDLTKGADGAFERTIVVPPEVLAAAGKQGDFAWFATARGADGAVLARTAFVPLHVRE